MRWKTRGPRRLSGSRWRHEPGLHHGNHCADLLGRDCGCGRGAFRGAGAMMPVTPELLQELLEYVEQTGELFWRVRRADRFLNPSRANVWNSRYAGQRAFTAINAHGYQHGGVFKKTLLAHRVAWAVAFGEWPNGEIDHINGFKTDNRLINLRDVSRSENLRNASLSRRNKSGAIGVYLQPDGKWGAEASFNRRRVFRQVFETKEEAIRARQAVSNEYGFHPLHGKVAAE